MTLPPLLTGRMIRPGLEAITMAVNSRRHDRRRVDVVIQEDLARDSRKGVSMPTVREGSILSPTSFLSDARRLFLRFQADPANPMLRTAG